MNSNLILAFSNKSSCMAASNISIMITDDGAILKVTLYVFSNNEYREHLRLGQVKSVYDTAQPTERM